jgi:hypothetical protein
MRWDRLFLDLEQRFDRELAAEAAMVAADEARAQHAALTLAQRTGDAGLVVLRTRGGTTMRITIESIGPGWLAGRESEGGASVLVPVTSIEWMRAERADGDVPTPARRNRITLAIALRELSRRRSIIELDLGHDRPTGTIDRVAVDHLDLAVHPADEPRRAAAVTATWLVAFTAIDRLRWRG